MKSARTGYGPDEMPIREGCFVFPDNERARPRLIGARCRRCGDVVVPKRKLCTLCDSDELMEKVFIGERGTLYTYTMTGTLRIRVRRRQTASGRSPGRARPQRRRNGAGDRAGHDEHHDSHPVRVFSNTTTKSRKQQARPTSTMREYDESGEGAIHVSAL